MGNRECFWRRWFCREWGLTVLGILMVLGWRGKWLNARIAWNGYREKETRIVYTLTPEQFYERLPASGHRLEYTLITAVLEDRERFFLVMGTQAHILKKSDFVKGDPENFRRFICEVTGKTGEVRDIRFARQAGQYGAAKGRECDGRGRIVPWLNIG